LPQRTFHSRRGMRHDAPVMGGKGARFGFDVLTRRAQSPLRFLNVIDARWPRRKWCM
jgi:hypothetical protein